MKRLRYILEAGLLHLALALIRLLPIDTASNMGGWIGRRVGPRLPVSDAARANLRLAFPEKSAAEIETVVRGMWDNLGRVAFEYPHLEAITEPAAGRVVWDDTAALDAVRDARQAAIFVAGHFENWEVTSISTARRGFDLSVIVREPNNPLVRKTVDRMRTVGGGTMIPKGSPGARRALALLREGRVLGMLVDQRMNDGIAAPFFGIDAMTPAAPAQLALRYRCPVVPIGIRRSGPGRFRLRALAPLELPDSGDRHADTLALMTRLNGILEAWIRERPEAWLWLHRRWPEEAYRETARRRD